MVIPSPEPFASVESLDMTAGASPWLVTEARGRRHLDLIKNRELVPEGGGNVAELATNQAGPPS